VDELTEKAKWIKEYEYHNLLGGKFDEELPNTIYYKPIDSTLYEDIDGKKYYDFTNIQFTTKYTEGETIQFEKLYVY
jgi:hypothetical protein